MAAAALVLVAGIPFQTSASTSAGAIHSFEHEHSSAGWVTIALNVTGQTEIDLIAPTGRVSVLQLKLYHADGTYLRGTLMAGSSPSDDVTIHLRSDAAGEMHYERPGVYAPTIEWYKTGLGLGGLNSFKLVAWAAGVENFTFRITSESPFEVDNVAAGSEAYVWGARDFAGAPTVDASLFGARFSHVRDGIRPFEVKNHLIGFFSGPLGSDSSIVSAEGRQECPCSFSDVSGPDSIGPGKYTAHYNGTERLGFGIVAGWADVIPPP